MARNDRKLFTLREPITGTDEGVPFTLNPTDGLVYEDEDPLVKSNPGLFEPFVPRIRQYPGRVEQATAAPGERRNR